MKRFVLALAAVLALTLTAGAQEAGRIWTGGSLGLKSSKTTGDGKLTNFTIVPEVGYNLSDHWGIGLKLGYKYNESYVSHAKVKSDGFTVHPFARYSFLNGKLGGLFLDGGAGYSYSKEKGTGTKTQEWEAGLRPGVRINVSDNVSLTGKFGFLGYQYEKYGSRKTNTFGFDFDLTQIQLGINFVF